jgi:shikimate dehydrogenase
MKPEHDRYAVIGHPIGHSLSPWIHAQFAQQTQQNMVYTSLDIEPDELPARVRAFFAHGLGLNFTLPHKQAVLALLDELHETARLAGAVNTIVRRPDGSLYGDNTDGIGLAHDLSVNLGISLAACRVLLLGAGGATRGVLAPLLALEPAEVVVANRNRERAYELARRFASHGPVAGAGFDELGAQRFDVIINATSAALTGALPPLSAAILRHASVCYDLTYGHAAGRFLSWAREHGVERCFDGAGMLVEQAAESFLRWRGIRPQTAPVLAALRARTAPAEQSIPARP